MANVTGVRARDSWSTNREKLDFAEGIALLDPNENPFTLMTMKYGKKTSGNIKHSWFEDVLVPETDTADTCTTTATTLWTVDNVDRFGPGDLILVNSSKEVALCLTAQATTGAGTLGVIRDYGATSGAYTAVAAALGDGDTLTIIGNAFEAGHDLPEIKSTLEVQMDNWCQDVRTPFGITEVAAAAAVRGESDWPYQMMKAGKSHQRKIEYGALWGRPMPGDAGLYDGTTNTNPATSGGMWHFLTGGTGFTGTGSDRLIEQSTLTKIEFLTWLRHAFQYGARQKVCFCSSLFREQLDTWGITDLNTFSSDKVYGIAVGRWVSALGEIVFVTHKMLDGQTDIGGCAFLIDMESVKVVTYSSIGSTRMRTLEPYKSDGSTVKKAEFQTISCLEVKNPEKHACIYGMTAISAT